jgi:hypothetical protein
MYADYLELVKGESRFNAMTNPDKLSAFSSNINKIGAHNAEDHSYTMGVSPYTDLTWEEFQEFFGLNDPQTCSAT